MTCVTYVSWKPNISYQVAVWHDLQMKSSPRVEFDWHKAEVRGGVCDRSLLKVTNWWGGEVWCCRWRSEWSSSHSGDNQRRSDPCCSLTWNNSILYVSWDFRRTPTAGGHRISSFTLEWNRFYVHQQSHDSKHTCCLSYHAVGKCQFVKKQQKASSVGETVRCCCLWFILEVGAEMEIGFCGESALKQQELF